MAAVGPRVIEYRQLASVALLLLSVSSGCKASKAVPSPSQTGASGVSRKSTVKIETARAKRNAPRATEPAQQEEELFARINAARASGASCPGAKGAPVALPPLRRNEALTRAARAYGAEIAKTGVFSHESLEGRRPGSRALRAGYAGRDVVENLAWGQSEPAAVVSAWLNSPSHCAALLSTHHVEAGVGYARGSESKPIWAFLAGAGP
jgi:uncharacterized protein YkwD